MSGYVPPMQTGDPNGIYEAADADGNFTGKPGTRVSFSGNGDTLSGSVSLPPTLSGFLVSVMNNKFVYYAAVIGLIACLFFFVHRIAEDVSK